MYIDGRMINQNDKDSTYTVFPAGSVIGKETTLFGKTHQVVGRTCSISNEVNTTIKPTGTFLTEEFNFEFDGNLTMTESCYTSQGEV